MVQYIVRRVLINIPVLIGITMAVFLLISLAPGDPLSAYISPELGSDPATLAALRTKFGFDQPLPVRYLNWLGQALQGNLGYRLKTFDPVWPVILERIPATLMLMATALSIGIVVGVPLGIFSALRKYSVIDMILTGGVFLGVSTPAFLIGLGSLFVFSLGLRLFPAGGMHTLGQEESVIDTLHHLALPALILSANYIASMLRYTRASMLDVISEQYVTTARAKGLSERAVILKHALSNALIPIVTVIGFSIPNLLAGAVFTETIFAWPGMGSVFVDGVNSRDFPLMMGVTLVTATAVLIFNLLTDIVYALINPKIRYA
ncbi:MAG TPA: ABC transporter permease [Thermoflexales bacterium]|nr:ABC transporter permease [Anaerolineae bacterium]HQV29613.1 ABC transporter permease [Thermoflexales bacterium]HQX11201.1 ABC transporter permease [Thermoflexales bacterium]HQZ53866.1 ABC transporter permease [Thermoflexales bacterium]HRA54925.1 ABC transporter permease [Thermoflexales bacterium]